MLGDKTEFEGSKAQLLASPDMKTHFVKAAELNAHATKHFLARL